MSYAIWIRKKLLEAGKSGVCLADLHKERKEKSEELVIENIFYKGGTYHSFSRYFHWLKQLGFVEGVREEPSTAKGTDGLSLEAPRVYYQMTDKGKRAPIEHWHDPVQAVHPEWTPSERKYKYRPPTGRPRGRPRKVWSEEG